MPTVHSREMVVKKKGFLLGINILFPCYSHSVDLKKKKKLLMLNPLFLSA